MIVRRAAAGMLAIFLGTIAMCANADEKSVRKEIEASCAKCAQDYKKKDTRAFFALFTPDMTFTEGNGQVAKRAQFEQTVKQGFAMMKSCSESAFMLTSFALKGDTTYTAMTTTLKTTTEDPQHKDHQIDYVSKSKVIWVKTKKGWRIKNIQAVSETMTMDGKPVPSQSSPPKK